MAWRGKARQTKQGKEMVNHPNRKKVKNWPEYLKNFRAENNYTQKQLADKLQISLRNIENWEENINKPPEYLKKALDQLINIKKR